MTFRTAAAAFAFLGACSSSPAGSPCAGVSVDDGIACTADACDPATGLVTHAPSDAACPAGEVCSPAAGCRPPGCADLAPVAGTAFKLRTVVSSGLESPVHLAAPAGDAHRLFVVEQPGRVRVVKDGVLLSTPYLDLVDRVVYGGERGLLSVAFHPAFASNGKLYVYYTGAGGEVRISEFTAPSPQADSADPGTEVNLVAIAHGTYTNHNGGLVLFGPDGFLYAGVGDGGGGGDPFGSGQDTASLLGKLLRIDVASPGTPVPGNPFASAVYDHGLRNPWRFSFDRLTGDLYIGDVGQNAWEEIDFKPAPSPGQAPPAGTNWGWNLMEGTHCYAAPGCDPAAQGLALPILEYGHGEGQSVTGGHVYRGPVMPDLAATGTYFYADFYAFVRTFRVVMGRATSPQDVTADLGVSVGNVSSFGEDGCGELYVVSYGGAIHKLVPGP
ncbi:MAG TPA: PQQ-dependent sugar dehydrogenase [Anaeromyxobacteraceae bacterium]|jgi:glucose/arabinose dehydrogenase